MAEEERSIQHRNWEDQMLQASALPPLASEGRKIDTIYYPSTYIYLVSGINGL